MILGHVALVIFAQDQALDFLHRGARNVTEWEQALQQTDPHHHALIASAALAPARVSQLSYSFPNLDLEAAPDFSVQQLQHAHDVVLSHLQDNHECSEREALLQRFRPWIKARDIQNCLADEEQINLSFELISLAQWSVAHDFMPLVVSASYFTKEQRIELLRRWLSGGGRRAFKEALMVLDPTRDTFLIRAALSDWEDRMRVIDLPLVAQFVNVAEESLAQTARLMWARHEQDPQTRWEIFQAAIELGPSMRDGVVRALARRGPSEKISNWMLQHLAANDSPLREFADNFLPHFLTADKLYSEYAKRFNPLMSKRERALKIAALARLPQPEAREIAARWLVGGGWTQGRIAEQVARELAANVNSPLNLEQLFVVPNVSVEVALPLARVQAKQSSVARQWLRELLEVGSDFEQGQAVRALAAAAHKEDLALLFSLVQDLSFDPSARAFAIEALVKSELEWDVALVELIVAKQFQNDDFEVQQALVRDLVIYASDNVRQQVLNLIEKVDGPFSGEFSYDLKLAALSAQASAPRANEYLQLEKSLVAYLRAHTSDPYASGLPDPRELSAEFPAVHANAQALAAVISLLEKTNQEPAMPGEQAKKWRPELKNLLAANKQPLSAWVHILQVLPSGSAFNLAKQLSEQDSLPASIQLRLNAAALRHAFEISPKLASKWIRVLLFSEVALSDYPWDLAHGLSSTEAISWVLPADRLAEEHQLQVAMARRGTACDLQLEQLLDSFVTPSVLFRASYLTTLFEDGHSLKRELLVRARQWDAGDRKIKDRLNQFTPAPF